MKSVTDVIQRISKPVEVFGAAPSLKAMLQINKTSKKKVYRGAHFWYYFRVYLPYTFPALFLIFMILGLTKLKTVEGNLLLGSVLSLLMSLSVVVSYVMIIPWRKHPSSLVLYRALTSIVFSINIILEAISTNETHCRNYATVTQFTMLAGECWLTSIALDLVYSLTNPFISYKSNLKKYQIMVWTFTSFITFVFFLDTSCQGRFDQGICWVKITSTSSPCLWGYFLFWIVCMYAYQMYSVIFAYLRLRKGLPLTFEIRKQCAKETFKCLWAYACYICLLMFIFAIISSDPTPAPGSDMSNFSLWFLFVIANRGSVDGIVWFMLHDFQRDDNSSGSLLSSVGSSKSNPPVNEKVLDTGLGYAALEQGDGVPEEEEPSHHGVGGLAGGAQGLIDNVTGEIEHARKELTKTFTDIADLAIEEMDETDLSPQVNTALRQQIVQYVTTGVKNAIRRENIDKKPMDEISDIMDGIFAFKGKDPAVTEGLQVLEFLLDGEHPFKAFAPDMFKALRLNEGIDDDRYLKILSASANERLSEGASGAFMFFCGGGEFIVKTIKPKEAKVLHQSMNAYSHYLKKNSNSFLCRFLGSYSLAMYSQTFYFVVMLNCFDPSAYINERFDIKGSWVGRSAEPAKKTKKVVCRHCNSYFVSARGEQCTAIVGKHEANVVLKDNDLRTKISLHPDHAQKVVDILKKDSDLLGKLGVLDYSLLLGIKKWKFEVNITDEMMAFNPKGKDKKPSDEERNIFESSTKSTFAAKTVSGPAVYHLGIVDFLQDWTFKKRLERAFKIYMTRKDPDGLSVMEPHAYKLRFQSKMDQIFDMDGTGGGIGWTKDSNSGKFADANATGASDNETSTLLPTTPERVIRSSSGGDIELTSSVSSSGSIGGRPHSPSLPHVGSVTKITKVKHVTKVIGGRRSKKSMDASDETDPQPPVFDPDATVVIETSPNKVVVTATKTSTEMIPKSAASPSDESEYIAVGGFNDVDLC